MKETEKFHVDTWQADTVEDNAHLSERNKHHSKYTD